MQTITCLPLESYKARYTEYLMDIERKAFSPYFNADFLLPSEESGFVTLNINTGEVLDSVARPLWALQQMEMLLKKAPRFGKVWFSDFYHPGLDALPYTRGQFVACSYLWAQTFDIFDFTQQFLHWMRPIEIAGFNIYSKVFVASPLLKELITVAMGPEIGMKIEVVGLPFDSVHIQSIAGQLPASRPYDVVWSSRFDMEKNPDFFLDLVESRTDLRFVICTGHPMLKGSAIGAVKRATQLAATRPNLTIAAGLSKPEYLKMLASSKVQFNAASQDWVSFTLLEALSMGCLPLYPNWRDFPQALQYRARNLYAPEDISAADMALQELLVPASAELQAEDELHAFEILRYHDGTLDRIAKSIEAL